MNEIQASIIMGDNFISSEVLKRMNDLNLAADILVPDIPFSQSELEEKKENYLLLLGISHFQNGRPVTIRELRKIFGMNPQENEPCFYNQDWYEHETFIDQPMKDGWFLIRKTVYEESRAVLPTDLEMKYVFPAAITCVYAFFTAWLALGMKLWYHDFIWCSDQDHNGDRVYVGKYHDIDGVNKNGFSIHRHLALRPCYACID